MRNKKIFANRYLCRQKIAEGGMGNVFMVEDLLKNNQRLALKTINDDIINGMIDVAKQIRNAFSKGTMMSTMSARGLIACANKTEKLGHIGRGLQYTLFHKLSSDDQKVVEDMYHKVFARKITDE